MAVKAGDQISIVDITDAYSIMLTSEAVTFNATSTTSLGVQQTAVTRVVAYMGSEGKAPTVGTIVVPSGSGITSQKGTASTTGVDITFTFPSTLASGGEISIPVTVDDVTITKKFNYAIAFKGNPGGTGSTGVSMRNKGAWTNGTAYTAGTSGGTYIDIVTLNGSSYMCKSGHTASSSNQPPNSTYWTLISEKGEQGIQGDQGIQGPQGPQGDAGADAITLVITSSAGTIFKNSEIATTLTAHVYKAGVEVTGTALTNLGTIKWYKNGSSTAESTGQTKTISAGDVQNKVTYIAQLEA